MKCNNQTRLYNYKSEKGQVAILGLLALWVILLVAAAAVDIYSLLETRNWAYQVAQNASMVGVHTGKNWSRVAIDGCLDLSQASATSAAQSAIVRSFNDRGITSYSYQIRVLPNAHGGAVTGWPPQPVRLGGGSGDWSNTEPSVAVYLSFQSDTYFLALLGRPTVTISTFGAASLKQASACP